MVIPQYKFYILISTPNPPGTITMPTVSENMFQLKIVQQSQCVQTLPASINNEDIKNAECNSHHFSDWDAMNEG